LKLNQDIVFLTPSWFDPSSVIGGGERYVDELAASLARLGAKVKVVSFGTDRETFSRRGVRYEIFRGRHFLGCSRSNPLSLSFLRSLRPAGIVHVHQICTMVADLGVAFGGFGTLFVGTDHGGGGHRVLNRRIPIYRKYHAVIGQSKLAGAILEKDFSKDKIKIIPGGVDRIKFPVGQTRPSRDYFLFVGRLMAHKGVFTLINAFRTYCYAGGKKSLKVVGRVGETAFYEKLRKAAEGLPVEFRHSVSDDELPDLYQNAALTVIPSEAKGGEAPPPELMGFTVLESQACGTPVLVSDAGPMREFISPETGMVFPAGNPDALGDALHDGAERFKHTSPDLCREKVRAFSWEEVATRHLELYEELRHRKHSS